jgi:hypothetical protein
VKTTEKNSGHPALYLYLNSVRMLTTTAMIAAHICFALTGYTPLFKYFV